MNHRRRLYRNTPALQNYLRKLMAQRGWKTPRDVAREHDDLHHQSVDAVLYGKSAGIRIETMRKLAEAMSVELDTLVQLATVDERARPWTLPPSFDALPDKLRPPLEIAFLAILRTAGLLPRGHDDSSSSKGNGG